MTVNNHLTNAIGIMSTTFETQKKILVPEHIDPGYAQVLVLLELLRNDVVSSHLLTSSQKRNKNVNKKSDNNPPAQTKSTRRPYPPSALSTTLASSMRMRSRLVA